MRPLLHAKLVNGRFGDPALYIETLFETRAILFDLGDISRLTARQIQRLEHVFVSHAHIDHFIGFDRLLRVLVGREKRINLYGPDGFVDHVYHKLNAYRWNLADNFASDLAFVVTEVKSDCQTRSVQFRLKNGFKAEPLTTGRVIGGVLYGESNFRICTELLEHRTLCLGFAIAETAHINVWKSRLDEFGLPVGRWLRELKLAVVEGKPDDYPIRIERGLQGADEQTVLLGNLRPLVTVTPGQKIAYVTDVANTSRNREAIVRLVRGVDLLFIEAVFAEADTGLAAARAHLTTTVAGRIARKAGVRRVEPFHFSPRYTGQERRMLHEVYRSFCPTGDSAVVDRKPRNRTIPYSQFE